MTQEKTFHEIPFIRNYCNHKGSYTVIPIFNNDSQDQLPKFRTSFYETNSSEFLVQGNFKYTQFLREHWYWRDSVQAFLPCTVSGGGLVYSPTVKGLIPTTCWDNALPNSAELNFCLAALVPLCWNVTSEPYFPTWQKEWSACCLIVARGEWT